MTRLGWDAYFTVEIQRNGVGLPVRGVLNFIGAADAVIDDEVNEVTKVYLGGGGGGGGLEVTGTGFVHATGGVIDDAAKLVTNVDIATNANIAISKLANADADGKVLRRAGGALGFGAVDLSNANAVTGLGTDKRILYNNGGVVAGVPSMTWDGTNLSIGAPIGGDASSPRRNRVGALPTPGGTVTPDASITACPELVITTNTNTIYELPAVNGAHFFVRNQGTGAHVFRAATQTGVTIAPGEKVEIFCNGVDYERVQNASSQDDCSEPAETHQRRNRWADAECTQSPGAPDNIVDAERHTSVYVEDAGDGWGGADGGEEIARVYLDDADDANTLEDGEVVMFRLDATVFVARDNGVGPRGACYQGVVSFFAIRKSDEIEGEFEAWTEVCDLNGDEIVNVDLTLLPDSIDTGISASGVRLHFGNREDGRAFVSVRVAPSNDDSRWSCVTQLVEARHMLTDPGWGA